MSEPLRTSHSDGFRPWQTSTEEQDKQVRPAKRARVALACQRCKSRKQKCDGGHPSCSKCRHLQAHCEYVIPAKPMPFGKNQYIKALERRVNELEDCLVKAGLPVPGRDHWQYLPRPEAAVAEDSKSVNTALSGEQETSLSRRRSTRTGDGADGAESDSDDEEAVFEWQQGFDSMVRVLRDLSLEVNGGYIGASSHITMGRLLGSIVKRKKKPLSVPLDGGREDSSENSMSPVMLPGMIQDESDEAQGFDNVPDDVADRLLVGYMKHISTRFPLLSTPWIRQLHARRKSISDPYERSTLHMVYATGGRFLETTGEVGNFFPEGHHDEALKDLHVILEYHDTRSVTALALLAVFCLRAPVGPGAWAYNRLAMLIAIDLGLHRQPQTKKKITFEQEMNKRIFWSCYAFDRQISIPLGRPFAISDQDIDVPLPFDVNEENEDVALLEKAAALDLNTRRTTSSSMSSFLHIVRLRKIESKIQQTVYRVDQTTGVSDAVIDGFLDELSTWKSLIPMDTRKKTDLEARAFDGYDYYMVFYFKCLRLLLYPQLSKKPQVNPRFLKACAAACGGVCQTYKRLHQTMSVGYSMMSLQTVFLAGLTLVYCCWIDPKEIYTLANSENIGACSIMLFVITERVKTAEKYRNAFEIVKQRVVDQIAQQRQPRQAIGSLTSELKTTLSDLKSSEDGYQHDQFAQIVTDISGKGGANKGAAMAATPVPLVVTQAPVPDMTTQQQIPQPQPQPQQQQQRQQHQHQHQHHPQHPHYVAHPIPPHIQHPQQQIHPSYQQYSGFDTESMPALGMAPVEYMPNNLTMSNGLPMEHYIPMNNDGFDHHMI